MDSDETYRTLYFPGLVVEVLEVDRNRKPTVVAFTISSRRWSASGVRIGSTPSQVVRRFGKANSVDREEKGTIYRYVTPGNLGGVDFEFRNGKLVRILMAETLC
jgi:aspartate/methionine/tyrosine aminotransferase